MFVIGYSLYSLLGIRQIGNNQSTFALFDMWPEMNRMIVLMIIFQFVLLLLQIKPSSQNERERFDVLSTLYVQKLSVIDGNFGKNYTNQINSNSTIIYKFKYSEFKNKVLQIRWNDEDIYMYTGFIYRVICGTRTLEPARADVAIKLWKINFIMSSCYSTICLLILSLIVYSG
jgi:hypothetical protein